MAGIAFEQDNKRLASRHVNTHYLVIHGLMEKCGLIAVIHQKILT
jgi:hypothetical protein